MADIFGYNTRKTPYGTVRTPAVDYSALGQYGLDFIKNTVNLPTTLWNANKYVGNKMLNGVNALNDAMYTYDPKTAGKQVKQFVTGQPQSNTKQIIPNQPSGKNTNKQTIQQTVNSETGSNNNTGRKKTTSSSFTQGKNIPLPDGQNVSQYMAPEGYVDNSLIYPASAGITNQNVNTKTVTPSDLSTLSFADGVVIPKDSEWAGQGENVLGYLGTPVNQQTIVPEQNLYTNQVDTSQWTQNTPVTVNNQNTGSAFLNNANSPAKVSGQVYWSDNGKPYVYQPPYTSTGDTFKDMYAQQLMQQTSPADAWSKVGWGDAWNKGEGISGGLSNLWDKLTAQTGNAMNPQASALEKAFGGLSSAANIYSALQNQKYQSKLADIYGQQVDLQKQAQQSLLDKQNKAQSNYEASFK